MTQLGGVRLPLFGVNPELPFRNDSGEEIPARAVIQITGSVTLANGEIVLKADKPDTAGLAGEHYVNGPMSVIDGGYGRCIVPVSPTWVSYDTAATPAFGENWGPQDGSFKIATAGSGILIVGNVNSTDAVVLARNDKAAVCDPQNEIQIINIFGSPTGGTFDLDVTVDGTTETMTFNYNDTAAACETELETHSKIASGDVDCTGGPLPNTAVQVEFQGARANVDIPIMMPDHGSLTGGSGVAVLISVDQHGRA
jgi:hypothetical protein